jgi:glycosyltransferase involved in cell wall biosynthesis
MNFSIVTPSFRNSNWLKLCIASVADQAGVTLEHIVQDSCSDDGTQDWLPRDKRVKAFIEKDTGMYDAVNRGFRRAQGEIVAYLNCDEQYLPGALKRVHDFFAANPSVDAVFADTIVVNAEGHYLCHRKSLMPRASHLWVRFSNLTCAIFLRRKCLEEKRLYFDTQWRDLGDVYWVMDMANRGVCRAVLDEFTSVFYDTGENMNLKPNARRETQVRKERTPKWIMRTWVLFVLLHRFRMLKSGAYRRRPFDFSIYTPGSPDKRVLEHAAKPTGRWPGRPTGLLPGST